MLFRPLRVLALSLAIAAAAPVGADAALIANGSFEAPPVPPDSTWITRSGDELEGWRVGGDGVDQVASRLWPAPAGGHSLDLNALGPGRIAQTVPTTPGAHYELHFTLAANRDPVCASEALRELVVRWDGRQVAYLTFDPAGRTVARMGWRHESLAVRANGDATELEFASLTAGACGPALDDVRLAPADAPPSAWSLAGDFADAGWSFADGPQPLAWDQRDPASYLALAPDENPALAPLTGWSGTTVDPGTGVLHPGVRLNPTDDVVVKYNVPVPPHEVIVHPWPGHLAVAEWHSPFTGHVRISGGVRHLDPFGGDGVSWWLDESTAAGTDLVPLAAGAVRAGGVAQQQLPPSDLAFVPVHEGDRVGLAVGAGPLGDPYFDTTHVSLEIERVEASVAIAVPANGAVYGLGEAVEPSYRCYGAAVATCLGASVDTATAGTREFTVSALDADGRVLDRRIVAYSVEAPATHTLTIALDGTGRVTSTPGDIDCGDACSAAFDHGTSVTLHAASAAGWHLTGWSQESCGADLDCTVIVEADRTVMASFARDRRSLTVARVGMGSGRITSAPAGIDCGATCSADFEDGTPVTLTAAPEAGSTFSGWSGEGCSGMEPCTVTMDAARTVTATFASVERALVVTTSGLGTVTSAPAGIDCGGTCTAHFADGSPVTLHATAAAGWRFAGWSGEGCPESGDCVLEMTADRLVQARFDEIRPTLLLTVIRLGSGTGRVTSSPAGIDCGGLCTTRFEEGRPVTLHAEPAAGSHFVGWSEVGCGFAPECVITLSDDRLVTAIFDAATTSKAQLTVVRRGQGSGTVTSEPAGIDCRTGGTCTATYDAGTTVILHATAAPGSRFSHWSEPSCGSAVECVVPLAATTGIEAYFDPRPPTLTITRTGTGGGGVGSTPAGIDCGAACVAEYTSGTVVTLHAEAAPGSVFAGWSGGCSGTSDCTVTMTGDRDVFARFEAIRHELIVEKVGTGDGHVASAPPGIDCGGTCHAAYDEDTQVTLRAEAAPGSRFVGWSGGCAGADDCVVTMNTERTVLARFETVLRPLAVDVAGTGTGTVTSVPAGIDCGTVCVAEYPDETVVTLRAAAHAGSRFVGWSGEGCTGTAECTVTMDRARNVTATFDTPPTRTITITRGGTGEGSVRVLPDGPVCDPSCRLEVPEGTQITVRAEPAPGMRLRDWSDPACGKQLECTITVDSDVTLTPNFEPIPSYGLTVTRSGNGSGRVTSAPPGIDCGVTCHAGYDDATIVTLHAESEPGTRFDGWSGEECSGTGDCVVTMDRARSVDARFVAAPVRILTVTRAGSGVGQVGGAVDCGGLCTKSFPHGTVVTLTAVAAAGSRVAGWSGDGCAGTGECTVTMDQDRLVTATFVALRDLVVTHSGTGQGRITGPQIDCGATCHASYDDGTHVTLHAAAEPGSTFAGWSGAGCSGTGDCEVTMDQARVVDARFETAPPKSLVVTRSGNGSGHIGTTPPGIDCGGTCTAHYPHGLEVVLHADPDAGSRFVRWTGESCGEDPDCRVTMDRSRNVDARFERVTHRLAVQVAGEGRVTGPAGIDCGASCEAVFEHGTTVALHAAPADGWRVAGWADPACGRHDECAVLVDGDRTVVVTFEQIPLRVLTVGHAGEGTITSTTPRGIDCGGACTSRFREGTSVKLHAEPAAGWKLVDWVNVDCGVALDCSVAMTADRTVAARFERITPRDIVNVVLLGSGTVTISPGPTVCKVSCLPAFDEGTPVALLAEPAAGWRFDGWTTTYASAKACGAAPACKFSLVESVNLTARFTPLAARPVLGKTGLASVEAGTVSYRPPARAARRLLAGYDFIRLTGQQDIPVGSVIDTSKGRLRLTIQDAKQRERSIVLAGGIFRFTQRATGRAKGVAALELVVADAGSCKRSPGRVLQRLVAAGGVGFRTVGRYASAAAKRATWTIEERCAGTRVAVKRGSVAVGRPGTARSTTLRAGKALLVRPSRSASR